MSAIVGFLFMIPLFAMLWVMAGFVVWAAYKVVRGEGSDLLP